MTELMGPKLPWQRALPKRVDWSKRPPDDKARQHGDAAKQDRPVKR